MSINRGMDKEGVVHIYNGMLLSHKKEWNWIICRDVGGPRDCHTEWNKSEGEKQTVYINTYTWNLERWYRWPYLQSRNRDTDTGNKHIDANGRRVWWMNWEIGTDIYTQLMYACRHPTLWDPTDCSPSGSSVHGILQARTLEWVAVPSSRGSSQLRGRSSISCISCFGRRVLYY